MGNFSATMHRAMYWDKPNEELLWLWIQRILMFLNQAVDPYLEHG